MEFKLYKEDLFNICETFAGKEGENVKVAFNTDGYGIGMIFLRNILLLFGEQYKVVGTQDKEWEDGEPFILVETNLPWELVKDLKPAL